MQSGRRAGKKGNQVTCFPELFSRSSANAVRRLTAICLIISTFTLLILPPAFAQHSGPAGNIPEDYGSGQSTPEYRLSRDPDSWRSDSGVKAFLISFWRGKWTYFIYLAIGLGVLAGIRKYEITRIRLKNQVRIANIETSKLKELDQLRSQFFANISHELRTPLTLIKGPVEQLIEEDTDLQRIKRLKMIHSNTTRLLELINQLLDLSRIESGNYNIKAGTGDIVSLVKGLGMSFASLADQKKIRLVIEESPDPDMTEINSNFYFDHDIVEKVINNLLSNAFKFTPENGSVTVKICEKNHMRKGKFLEIVISDTGIGIPADRLPYIYDRFYQVEPSEKRRYEGIGVGLAYVKELMLVHKGDIRVKSLPGKGTTFILRFPVGEEHFSAGQIISGKENSYSGPLTFADSHNDSHAPAPFPGTGFDGMISGIPGETNGKPLILIVEDHAQVRDYIKENLHEEHRVIEASDAFEGYNLAEQTIPDLIISDIMMPEMNGYELCEKIKTNIRTSHIPVIMLTARADEKDRILGLETGADDYLIKPFNARELHVRVRNLIENRRLLREKFSSNAIIKPAEISVSSRDASFIKELLEVVEKNIDDYTFSVEDLSKEVAMSQSQIHRKLKAIVNMSANQFIRSVRMHKAMELLQKNAGNISEISYMVGYDDPGYFTKSFKAFFGRTPSGIINKQ